jgi:hypothetical protein
VQKCTRTSIIYAVIFNKYICICAKDKRFLKNCGFWAFQQQILAESRPAAICPAIFSSGLIKQANWASRCGRFSDNPQS